MTAHGTEKVVDSRRGRLPKRLSGLPPTAPPSRNADRDTSANAEDEDEEEGERVGSAPAEEYPNPDPEAYLLVELDEDGAAILGWLLSGCHPQGFTISHDMEQSEAG